MPAQPALKMQPVPGTPQEFSNSVQHRQNNVHRCSSVRNRPSSAPSKPNNVRRLNSARSKLNNNSVLSKFNSNVRSKASSVPSKYNNNARSSHAYNRNVPRPRARPPRQGLLPPSVKGGDKTIIEITLTKKPA
jgi:hypothetical protein